ncbi:helix-turn-helix domain-containing protein [Nonomuraea antimicrobica]
MNMIHGRALRLFVEQGYNQTTVAQIAEEADVAKKTFFNHFPTKEDVLFADVEEYYVRATAEVIAERAPDEHVADLLLRIYERVVSRVLDEGLLPGDTEALKSLSATIMTRPAIQAKVLHLMFDLQQKIAEAVLKAYPDVLDPITAVAAVGSLMGAGQAAGFAGLRQGLSPDEQLASIRRALDVAVRGLRSL